MLVVGFDTAAAAVSAAIRDGKPPLLTADPYLRGAGEPGPPKRVTLS